MFCIYSFDFIKKNTDPQLMTFTPSKFLSESVDWFGFFEIQKIKGAIQTHTKMISRLASISRRSLFTPLTRSVATRIDGKAIGDDICKEIALEVPALEKELGRKP